MKKMIVVVIGFAATLAVAYCTTQGFAQTAGGAAQQTGTKIAVVNIGLVFNKYERAKAFKLQLEQTLEPFKTKAKKLSDEMKAWAEETRRPGFDQKKKSSYDSAILKNQRELEDMDREIKTLLGKSQEDNLVTLWKEVNTATERVAQTYGYQIVLGYGDPIDRDTLNLFPNVKRKMEAMDQGSSVPLYFSGSADLSQTIADTLNSWLKSSNPPGKK